MKIKFPPAKHLLITTVIAIFCLVVGYSIGANGFQASLTSFPRVHISREVPVKDLNFSLFWKVWDTLNASYFDKSKLVPSKMVYGAIQGMVSALGDPYTMFLAPSDNELTNQDLQGNFSGVGIEIGFKGTQLAVTAPLPGTPADKAGLKPGDFIIGIKDDIKKLDVGTSNLTLVQAVQDIRGPKGTKVTLTLVREGSDKPFTVDLIRDQINVPSVKTTFEGPDKNIAHIWILKFGSETFSEWQQAVQQVANKANVKGIIIDVRNNPGGYLQSAVDVASEFLPKDSVVVIEQRADSTKEDLRVDRSGMFTTSKIVVLINGGSASASEILAGALRDDKNIKLIGDKTFGKGTIQEPEDLEGGAGLHITIAKWLTPHGTWVHGEGLTPDVSIKDNPETKEDEQLQSAIQQILSLPN